MDFSFRKKNTDADRYCSVYFLPNKLTLCQVMHANNHNQLPQIIELESRETTPETLPSRLQDIAKKQALKNILSKVEGPLLHNYQRIRDQQWTAWALRGHAEDKNDVPFSNQKDMAQELVHLSSMVGFSNAGYPLRFIVNLQKALKSHTSTEKK